MSASLVFCPFQILLKSLLLRNPFHCSSFFSNVFTVQARVIIIVWFSWGSCRIAKKKSHVIFQCMTFPSYRALGLVDMVYEGSLVSIRLLPELLLSYRISFIIRKIWLNDVEVTLFYFSYFDFDYFGGFSFSKWLWMNIFQRITKYE